MDRVQRSGAIEGAPPASRIGHFLVRLWLAGILFARSVSGLTIMPGSTESGEGISPDCSLSWSTGWPIMPTPVLCHASDFLCGLFVGMRARQGCIIGVFGLAASSNRSWRVWSGRRTGRLTLNSCRFLRTVLARTGYSFDEAHLCHESSSL